MFGTFHAGGQVESRATPFRESWLVETATDLFWRNLAHNGTCMIVWSTYSSGLHLIDFLARLSKQLHQLSALAFFSACQVHSLARSDVVLQ